MVVLVITIALIAAVTLGLLPANPRLDDDTQKVAAAVIFAASYLALAIGKIPGLSIDRAGVALVGACLMVASGALPLEKAYKAIDLDTITLLLGMMIVVASLRLSGFFAVATAWVMRARRKAADPVVCGHGDVRHLLRLSGQRRDLPGAGADRAGADPSDGPQPGALPAGGRDGLERRVDRDDHRQSAEHHDRQLLPHSLRDFALTLGPVALPGLGSPWAWWRCFTARSSLAATPDGGEATHPRQPRARGARAAGDSC